MTREPGTTGGVRTPPAVELFVDAFEVYRKVVSGNHMFHRESYAAIEAELRARFDRPFSVLDLGCGDASALAPRLLELPVRRYRGVDLSAAALELAAEQFAGAPFPVTLQLGDLLEALREPDETHDLIFSGLALHHLDPGGQREFFRSAATQLTERGCLVLFDVMREEDQDLPQYLAAYCAVAVRDWHSLTPAELELVTTHIRENDRPETAASLRGMAAEAGLDDCRELSRHTWHRVLRFQRGTD